MSKILVKSKRESFWRSGIRFTRAGVEIDTTKLSEADLDAIKAEPNLIVTAATEKSQKPTQPDPVAPVSEEGKAAGKPKKGAK